VRSGRGTLEINANLANQKVGGTMVKTRSCMYKSLRSIASWREPTTQVLVPLQKERIKKGAKVPNELQYDNAYGDRQIGGSGIMGGAD